MTDLTDPAVKLFVIYAKYSYGRFYFALATSDLDQNEILAAFRELDIDVQQIAELSKWRITSQNVAVASVLFPGVN